MVLGQTNDVAPWNKETVNGVDFQKFTKLCLVPLSHFHSMLSRNSPVSRGSSPPNCGWSRCSGPGSQRWGSCWQPTPGWPSRRGRPSDPGCSFLKILRCEKGWNLEGKESSFTDGRSADHCNRRSMLKKRKEWNKCSAVLTRAEREFWRETVVQMRRIYNSVPWKCYYSPWTYFT